jgi:hypothetical protein
MFERTKGEASADRYGRELRAEEAKPYTEQNRSLVQDLRRKQAAAWVKIRQEREGRA